MEQPSSSQANSFSSLSEIMRRFNDVPFEQFQSELNDWFIANLSKNGVDIGNLSDRETLILNQLSELTKSIYHQAEVFQTLSDFNIKPPENED